MKKLMKKGIFIIFISVLSIVQVEGSPARPLLLWLTQVAGNVPGRYLVQKCSEHIMYMRPVYLDTASKARMT